MLKYVFYRLLKPIKLVSTLIFFEKMNDKGFMWLFIKIKLITIAHLIG